jgi:NADPH:quinone reductase-like Zn-dependent oxidoreductase
MRALRITEFGETEGLRLEEVSDLAPAAGEVLVVHGVLARAEGQPPVS